MPMMTEKTEAATVTVSREIAAPVERVYALWTDPAAFIRWFGMDPERNTDAAIDAREGGAWHLVADGEAGPIRLEGVFKAVEPNRRLVKSWVFVGPDGEPGNETEAEILFEPAPGGCRITVHHRRIRFTPERFRAGWTLSLERVAHLAQ